MGLVTDKYKHWEKFHRTIDQV